MAPLTLDDTGVEAVGPAHLSGQPGLEGPSFGELGLSLFVRRAAGSGERRRPTRVTLRLRFLILDSGFWTAD